MHSSWQIWDFFSRSNKDIFSSFNGIYAINTFDPVCLKMVQDYLRKHLSGKNFYIKMPQEISKSWLEDEFQTLSFFSSSDNFFIHQADQVSTDIISLISEFNLSDRCIFLSFESIGPAWKKILNNENVTKIQIESPRFWEFNKLLDFVCAYLRVPLSFEAKNWILSNQESTLTNFYNCCFLIKLNYPDIAEIGLVQVKSLFRAEKFDQFYAASLYSKKKKTEFFSLIIGLEGDFEKLRNIFHFLQHHMIKMMDTSYLSSKHRLTKYDKELQSTSILWSRSEILSELEKLVELEIRCKKKDQFIWHELKCSYLRSLGV